MLGWCYADFTEVAMALRVDNWFTEMMITHDLRKITGYLHAVPGEEQLKNIKEAKQMSKY